MRRDLVLGAASLLAAFMIAEPALAQGRGPTAGVRVKYYDVRGMTSDAIDRDLARRGPIVEGRRALAAAAISLRQSVALGRKGRGCGVVGVDVTVDADVTLPRWRHRSRGTAALRAQWDSFAAYAAAHEAMHVQIAEEYAARLERQLLALPSQPSCERVSARVKRVNDKLMAQYSAAQKKFDLDEARRLGTNVHGAAPPKKKKRRRG